MPGTGISVSSQRNLNNASSSTACPPTTTRPDLSGIVLLAGGRARVPGRHLRRPAEFGRASAGAFTRRDALGHQHDRRPRLRLLARRPPRRAATRSRRREDPLRQDQYGASGQGPLARDRTFLFANVEGYERVAHRLRDDRAGRGGGDQRRPRSRSASAGRASARATSRRLRRYGTAFARLDHPRRRVGRRPRCATASTTSSSTNARTAGGLNDVSRGTSLDNADHTVAADVAGVARRRARDRRRAPSTSTAGSTRRPTT